MYRFTRKQYADKVWNKIPKNKNKRCLFLFFGLLFSRACLLRARARENKRPKNKNKQQDRPACEMIVDNNSEPKNNNASLQSNN